MTDSMLPAHRSSPAAARDDALTLCAIAALAFIVADVAHEIIGHGAGLVAIGGRSAVMTTTRLIVDPRSITRLGGRIFSVGGPLGNLVLLVTPAFFALAPQRERARLAAPATVERSAGWMMAAALATALYVGLLGPGLRISW